MTFGPLGILGCVVQVPFIPADLSNLETKQIVTAIQIDWPLPSPALNARSDGGFVVWGIHETEHRHSLGFRVAPQMADVKLTCSTSSDQ